LPVSEVHDVHEPEDQRETHPEQTVGGAQQEPVQQMLEQLFHGPGRAGSRYFLAAKAGSAIFPSLISTRKMLGLLWPLSLPAGPSLSNLIGPLTPMMFTFHSASRTALGSGCPAILMASAAVRMPSWPRKPSVSPSKGWPRLFHSSTKAL